MARDGQKNPRRRWKQIVLSEQRGEKRVARKGRRYIPDRWLNHHKPRKNPKFKVSGKSRGTKIIEFPTELRLTTRDDVEVVAKLLDEIRESALVGHFKRITLDHTNVLHIAPEVALMIVAEIQRCEVYCGDRTSISGTHPLAPEVSSLLSDMGFYEALGIKSPVLPSLYKPRTYVQVERRNRTLPRVVDSLLSCFTKVFNFADEDRKRLHVALVECMDNVFEHAYAANSQEPYLYKEWWLVGYADHEESSIGFAFYDQGAGIPSTIRRKKKGRVLERLAGWSDGRWIERAVRKPISRHSSKRRGHGLDKLKHFIDKLGVDGSLRVIANRGDVEFRTNVMEAEIGSQNQSLGGSLVIWKLQGVVTES